MRKLQVFISSTFEDMRIERQAAVMAILKAGHIPAGMELFTAGDESQLEAVKRWIEESDIYLLILGGRYGSIEPTSGLSYTEVEYRHAVALGMPLFAVTISQKCLDQKVREHGAAVVEQAHGEKFAAFKSFIQSKMCAEYESPNDGVRLGVLEALHVLERRQGLAGWVRAGSAAASPDVSGELARLSQENASLRAATSAAAGECSAAGFRSTTGFDYDRLKAVLRSTPLAVDEYYTPALLQTAGRHVPNFLEAVWHMRRYLMEGCWAGQGVAREFVAVHLAPDLLLHGLTQQGRTNRGDVAYSLSQLGLRFLQLQTVERDTSRT